MPFVKRSQLADMIRKTDKIFTVKFTKRSDGSQRLMNCRNGVKKHLRGGNAPNRDPNDLITTYSLDAKGYRSIPVDGIVAASVNGQTYVVRD